MTPVPASRLRAITAALTACALLLSFSQTAGAYQSVPTFPNFDIGPSKGQVVGVAVGIAAVGAAIGVGVYYAVRHNHSLTGCVAPGANGLELTNEGDHRLYALLGDQASIKAGDRVRVSGKKQKKGSGDAWPFLVEKVSKDFGPCPVSAGTH